MTELSMFFPELKEEAEMGSRSRHGSGASSTGERTDPPDYSPTMADTLDAILKRLHEKRREFTRPEDVDVSIETCNQYINYKEEQLPRC